MHHLDRHRPHAPPPWRHHLNVSRNFSVGVAGEPALPPRMEIECAQASQMGLCAGRLRPAWEGDESLAVITRGRRGRGMGEDCDGMREEKERPATGEKQWRTGPGTHYRPD
jgi:hypothetical protein